MALDLYHTDLFRLFWSAPRTHTLMACHQATVTLNSCAHKLCTRLHKMFINLDCTAGLNVNKQLLIINYNVPCLLNDLPLSELDMCSGHHGLHGFLNVTKTERRHARDVPWIFAASPRQRLLAQLQLLISTESRQRTFIVVIAYNVHGRHSRPEAADDQKILIFHLLNFAQPSLVSFSFSGILLSTLSSAMNGIPFYWKAQKCSWKWFHRWARNGKCSQNAWRAEKKGKEMSKQNNECEPTNRFHALKDNDDPFLLLLFRNILVGNTLSAFEMCSNQDELMQNAYSVISFTDTHTHTNAHV